MTTTFHLIRHGSHGRLGHMLCGRMAGVSLSDAGRVEAGRMACALAREPIAAVYSSPLERTRETAAPLADALGLEVRDAPGFLEIDFGDWTGRPLDELHQDPRWAPWNARRSLNRPPNGESMGEAQMRAARAIQDLAAAHPDQTVAVVSHSDVIKAVLCWWLGVDLDFFHRFEIEPASVSTAVFGDWGVKVLRINQTFEEARA